MKKDYFIVGLNFWNVSYVHCGKTHGDTPNHRRPAITDQNLTLVRQKAVITIVVSYGQGSDSAGS